MAQDLIPPNEVLPPVPDDDGFGLGAQNNRVIQGRILKFVDGRYTVEGQPFPDGRRLVVQRVAQVAQYWKDGELPDFAFHTAASPVDVDRLNQNIPIEDWEEGLDGNPRPPWAMNCVVYLIDESDGAQYTSINSTIGQKRAFEELCQKVTITRKLRGSPVVPVIIADSTLMKTKRGPKARPDFRIIGWKGLADEQPLLKTIEPPTSAELIDDDIPDHGPAPKPAPKAAAKDETLGKVKRKRPSKSGDGTWDDPIPFANA